MFVLGTTCLVVLDKSGVTIPIPPALERWVTASIASLRPASPVGRDE
jgi:hypothetical protein